MADNFDYRAYFAREAVELPKIFKGTEASALELYLTNETTAQQCAVEITKYTKRNLPVNSKIDVIHHLIFTIAYDAADSHDKLIDLIKEIRSVPKSKETGDVSWAEGIECIWPAPTRRTRWSLVGNLGSRPTRRKRAQGTERHFPCVDAPQRVRSQSYYSSGLSRDLFNGLKLIVDTLEKKRTDQQLEMNLGATCAWLEYAATDIMNDAAKIPPEWDWSGGSEIHAGNNQLNKVRLSSWIQRLESLSAKSDLSDEVTEACVRAEAALQRAL